MMLWEVEPFSGLMAGRSKVRQVTGFITAETCTEHQGMRTKSNNRIDSPAFINVRPKPDVRPGDYPE